MASHDSGLLEADKDTYQKAWITMVISAATAGACFVPVTGQFLTGYIRSLGGGERANSVIANLPSFVGFFVFVGAYISSRAGKRFTFITFGSLRWLPWTLALFLPLTPAAWRIPLLTGLVILYGIMLHTCAPSWWSLLSMCVPPKMRGRFLGMRFRISSIVGIAAVLLFGYIVDFFNRGDPSGRSVTGYIILLSIAIPLGLVDALSHLILPSFKTAPEERRESFLSNLSLNFRAVFRSRSILLFCGTMVLLYFYVGGLDPYFMFYLQDEKYLALDMSLIAWLNTTAYAGTIFGYWLFGRACDRFGNKTVFIAAVAVRLVFNLFMFLYTREGFTLAGRIPMTIGTTVGMLFGLYFLGAFFWTGITIASSNIMMALAPAKRNEGVIATIIFIYQTGMIAAPFVANLIFTNSSGAAVYLTGLTGIPFDPVKVLYLAFYPLIIAILLMASFIRMPNEKAAGSVLRELLMPGGLRAMMVVLFADPEKNVSAKLKTVEKLQQQKHPFGIEHLITQLEDPSLKVRMQAAWALGAIKDSRSRVALEQKVADRNSQIQLDALRALAKLADPRSIKVMIKALESPNSLVRGQAALGLGEFRVRNAFAALAEHCREEEDMYVRECMYDSLSNFEDSGYVGPLIDDLILSDNPLTRRHLAMIAGRYIEGSDNSFYKVLSLEVEDKGAGGNDLLEKMLRRARRVRVDEARRGELTEGIDRLGELFWNNDLNGVVNTVAALFNAYVGILPGAAREKRAIYVLERMTGADRIAALVANQEYILLAVFAFFRLIEKPKD